MPKQSTVVLKPIDVRRMAIDIEGITPMIQHRWPPKALQAMRDKHSGIKTKNREKRDPRAEYLEAAYRTEDARFGVPVLAIKSSLIEAAHKDIGIEKKLVRKGLFLVCEDTNKVLPFSSYSEPIMREDCVRVGQGSADLRYRPEFREWSVRVEIEYDAELLTADAIINLLERAGFGVGLGEWRPERDGENGRFRVVTSGSKKEGK